MTRWVESPPHVDHARMRHITDEHLVDSLDLTAPGIEGLARAAGDTDAALREWRAYRASGRAPLPVGDIGRWARRREDRPSAPRAGLVLSGSEGVRRFFGAAGVPDGFLGAADLLLETEVDFLDSSRGRSGFYGFHYLYWMRPLLEAYALTGKADYAARYGELFSQWYDVRDDVAGDWPGLDVIWYSLGVWSRSGLFNQAISLLSAEPAFTDEQWRRTMKCLLGGARWAAEEHSAFRNGNWQLASVCELAHVASVYPEFGERDEWLGVARQRVEDHLELDFYADGGHYERSPSYHAMCLRALHVAALSADGAQWPLLDHPRLRAAHDWLAEMAHPAGWVPHLQDSHIVRPAEMLLVGHHLYGVPEWKTLVERWMGEERIVDRLDWLGPRPDGTDPVEFFFAAPSAEPDGSSTLLRSSGYAILRQGWTAADLTTTVNLGPYVGHELEPHSHHAALDFVASGWGEPLAWEAGGPPSYDDPGYYSWYQAGRGHNSVTLEGEPDSAQRNTVVESFWTLGVDEMRVQGAMTHQTRIPSERTGASDGASAAVGVDVVVGRHDAYRQRHRRRIVFIRSEPAYWLITDELADDEPVRSTWTVHGRSAWKDEGEHCYVSSEAPGLVVVPLEPPSEVEHATGPARLPHSQVAIDADVAAAADAAADDADAPVSSADFDAGDTSEALRERRSRPDQYGTIHGLHLVHQQARLHTVLVPFRHQAPAVDVERVEGTKSADAKSADAEAADVKSVGAESVVVRMPGVVDTIGPSGWTRTRADGTVERARWDLDPERPDRSPDTPDDARPDARSADGPALTGRGVLAWWCRTGSDGLTAQLVTDRRATVTVHGPLVRGENARGAPAGDRGTGSPGGPRVTVNGVQVAVATGDGPDTITLPSEGTWTVRIAERGVDD
ncbi:heparinase II/III family protein [Phytoactinopolyspora halotolerans]|uniref:Uncharacterized protein n=1 Tax=Phytoactinopolyspora halotolerans TaxID=1981512 RepID=A0A6L9SC99_9ACTN|nr:heparinase II/III family protein [Phytoactinopolyspora halotolerans]NEE02304.1 hypothetical protein [Phytoactinopolyspora halotolerans]